MNTKARRVLKEFGLPVSAGGRSSLPTRRRLRRKELGGPLWVVKSQIHAGGRGKGKFKEAGGGREGRRAPRQIDRRGQGIRPRDARQHPRHDPDRRGRQAGQPPLHRGRLGYRDASSTSRCWSTAPTGRVAFVVSTEGGMDIEQVAHDTPEKILTFSVDPATGVMPHHGRLVAKALGLKGAARQGSRGSGHQAL